MSGLLCSYYVDESQLLLLGCHYLFPSEITKFIIAIVRCGYERYCLVAMNYITIIKWDK